MVMFRIAIGRRLFAPSWPMTLLTLALCLLFVRLGQWQWQRGEHAQTQREAFIAGGGPAHPLAGQAVRRLQQFSHVTVSGDLDGAHQCLLDNRSHAGVPGYEVLTALHLIDGRTLLVDRGWIAFTGSRARLPDITLDPRALEPSMPGAGIRLTGRLDELPAGGLAFGHAAPPLAGPWPRVTSFPATDVWAASLGSPIEPRILLLDASAPGGLLRDWQPPGMAPERHWSYAVQWWGFAVTLIIIWFIMSARPARRSP